MVSLWSFCVLTICLVVVVTGLPATPTNEPLPVAKEGDAVALLQTRPSDPAMYAPSELDAPQPGDVDPSEELARNKRGYYYGGSRRYGGWGGYGGYGGAGWGGYGGYGKVRYGYGYPGWGYGGGYYRGGIWG